MPYGLRVPTNLRSEPLQRDQQGMPNYMNRSYGSFVNNPIFARLPPEMQQAYAINPDPAIDSIGIPEPDEMQKWRKGFAALARLGGNLGMSQDLVEGANAQEQELDEEIMAPIMSAYAMRANQNVEGLRQEAIFKEQEKTRLEREREAKLDEMARIDAAHGWAKHTNDREALNRFSQTGETPEGGFNFDYDLEEARKAKAARGAAELEYEYGTKAITDPVRNKAELDQSTKLYNAQAAAQASHREPRKDNGDILKKEFDAQNRLAELGAKGELTPEEEIESDKLVALLEMIQNTKKELINARAAALSGLLGEE